MKRVAAILMCATVAACSGVQTQLDPAGDQAAALHRLFLLMTIVCGAVYALVIAALGCSLWRARRSPDTPAGDRALGRWLRVAGVAIVAGLTVLIVGSFVADRALYAARGRPALQVRVTGHQWWWRIEYRDPATGGWIETANELHLPLGRPAHVRLGSGDVIHSFWVPNVSGKIDMVPGRDNRIDLTPRRAGWFRGQCAEFCGVQHAHMALDVKVETPAQFDAWLAAQAAPAVASDATFVGACGSCHAVRGTGAQGRAGPDLTHVAARRSIAAGTLAMTRGGVQGWIEQPQAIKPGTSMPAVPLTPAAALTVADYVARLK